MSLIDLEDTIVAIASPTTPAARGIVRLSGLDTVSILTDLGICCDDRRRSHRFDASIVTNGPVGEIPLSVMRWPTERSYTGQPSAELHTFGSLPVLSAIVEAATEAGARAARPGEFTMRAFLAGRIDLTQAEAVLGVIEAEKRGSLDQVLRQLAGNLSRPLEEMRNTVLDLLADVEAGLDFVDEDIQFISDEALLDRLATLKQQLDTTLQSMRSRSGGAARPIIALRGNPNAGKSCLINRLAGKQVAIVSPQAGTTRDTVTTEAVIDDRTVTLIDTAGIEQPHSEISRQSQEHADRADAEAIVRLWCVDISRDDFAKARAEAQAAADANRHRGVIDLWVATKSDLRGLIPANPPWLPCSAVTGDGIDALAHCIAEALASQDREETGSVVGTAARCAQSLAQAADSLAAAADLTRTGEGHEFVSAELRSIAGCLGEVTGAVYTDDILDRVFGRFCIGK